MNRRAGVCTTAIFIACAVGIARPAIGADWPSRPVRLEVGQAPGGSTDVVARLVAAQLSDILGKPVIVENRTGNSGSIAADYVAKSKPDGHTFLVVSSSYSINPSLSQLPFDPQKDLVPVSLLADAPFLLVVRPDSPARTVDDLLKLAQTKPGVLTYGSGGNGSSGHLAGALLSLLSRREFTHVPYKGAGPALTDLVGGHIDFLFASVLSSTPFVTQGQLRALGQSGPKRSAALPNIAAIAESVPDYSATTWYAILAPAGTSDDIVNRMSAAAHTAMQSKAVVDVLRGDGAEPMGTTPGELKAFLAAQIDKWSALVKRFGIRGE